MNAVITKTDAWKMPRFPPAEFDAWNGALELGPSPTMVSESAMNTMISMRPRMIPALAESRMSKYVRQKTASAVRPPHSHQPGEPVHQPWVFNVVSMNQPFRMKRNGGRKS